MSQDDEPGAGGYNVVADKVGLVPNIRGKDNLYQAIAVAVCIVLGALLGLLLDADSVATRLGLGALAGLIVGGFGSGLVLMIFGLVRKS